MKTFSTVIGQSTKAIIVEDRKIKRAISHIVPANSLAHIEFCRLEGGRLRITVDSAAWVSRLRFMERQIIGVLRQHQFDSHTISYHVSPEFKTAANKSVRRPVKARNGAASMEAAANAVAEKTLEGGDGGKLRQELLKLARTLRAE